MLLLVNSSVGFRGRRPVPASQVTKVSGVVPAVLTPPVAESTAPSRNGTILVFLAPALIPVESASVVPTSAGVVVTRSRATLDVELASMPRLTPFTKPNPPPEGRASVPAVTVATLLPPKLVVTVEIPVSNWSDPTVSVEFVAA